MFKMQGKIDKFMGKCNTRLQAVGSIKRKLNKTRSMSALTDLGAANDEQELDHLLENTDQVCINLNCIDAVAMLPKDFRRLKLYFKRLSKSNLYSSMHRIQNIPLWRRSRNRKQTVIMA